MTARREPAREVAVAVAAAVAGAGVALLAVGRPWVHAEVVAGPLRLGVDASGRALSSIPAALALVGLAGAAGILATRRIGRLLTGAVLVLCGAGILVASLSVLADPAASVRREAGKAVGQREATPSDVHREAWPFLAAAGGGLVLAAGGLTMLRGRRWPGMSDRYRAPREKARVSAWDALDQGEDPTI